MAETKLPIRATVEPATRHELADVVKSAYHDRTPLYIIGGGTALAYGLPARQTGIGLSLAHLGQVVDYPARDMTITVEAGLTVQSLQETLRAEGQWLPIDVPEPARATVGGMVATNWSGGHRYGYGTLRDYVIGIRAVDGRGVSFQAGGRVVKNVAGYDFCKLLTGSLGTLGVITELTFKLKPLPQRTQILGCSLRDGQQAEQVLSSLVQSAVTPAAIELFTGHMFINGDFWRPWFAGGTEAGLAVGLEGTDLEVEWMVQQLGQEWRGLDCPPCVHLDDHATAQAWDHLSHFGIRESFPLLLKINVVPSATWDLMQLARECDPQSSFIAHAGSGIVLMGCREFPSSGLSRMLIGRLRPAAARAGGHVVVLAGTEVAEMTRQSVWGFADAPWPLIARIKQQFDPHNILNPGRFICP